MIKIRTDFQVCRLLVQQR